MSSTIDQESRPRPGGRTARVTERISAAVLALLVSDGPDAVTFTNIAARAGVERSTLYRRYKDRWGMIGEAFFARAGVDLIIQPTGDFRSDMTAHLHRVAASLDSTLGRAMVVAAAMARLDWAREGGNYWKNRLQQLEPILAAGAASGQLRSDVDPVEFFAASDGPLFFQMLIVAQPIDDAFIERVVDNLCALYCRPPLATGSGYGRLHKETAS